MHALYSLEDIIRRMQALEPGSDHFRSDCCETASLIIGQHVDRVGPIHKDMATLFLEGLLMVEAMRARREDRKPSFANLVQQLRASQRRMNEELPDIASLYTLDELGYFPRLQVLRRILQNWLLRDTQHETASPTALAAIERLLKDATFFETQSHEVIQLNERAKNRRSRNSRKGCGKDPPERA
jgi:hypothetical protein